MSAPTSRRMRSVSRRTTTLSVQICWSAIMLRTWRVALSPAALASLVGMPMASWGDLTMVFSTRPAAATKAPVAMTEKALASSSGKPPIHWWKTRVRS